MSVNRDFFILGKPIDTRFGKVRFLSYIEYLMYIQEVNLISMNTLHIYYHYKDNIDKMPIEKQKKKELIETMAEPIKKMSLLNFVKSDKQFYKTYLDMFKMVIEDIDINVIDQIFDDEQTFMEFRKLFMEMNMVQEEEVSENELIQSFIKKSKEAKAKANREKTSLSDIVSSIVVGSGVSYSDVHDMTVLQVFATYYRIAAMKNFDASVTLATIPTDKKHEIESWAKSIDLFETQRSGMNMKEFNKQFGSLL